jgi:hypothetical protein
LGGEAIEMILLPVKKAKKDVPELKYAEVVFSGLMEQYSIFLSQPLAEWFIHFIEKAKPESMLKPTLKDMQKSYYETGLGDFQEFLDAEIFLTLRSKGLLFV